MENFELDRFKCRIWDVKKNKYRQGTENQADTCLDCLSGKVLYGEGMEIYGEEDYKDVILEKHTGLYDTKNFDVYEGDIVKDNKGRIAIIKWSITWCEYELKWVENNTGSYPEFWEWIMDKAYGTEVIGNIHENKDLLGV